MSVPTGDTGTRRVMCPYCLDPLAFDPDRLYALNEQRRYEPVDVSGEYNPIRRQDLLRTMYQKCVGTADMKEHYVPVPYLTHGEPLTVALVGGSAAGKTHLLAAMIGEVERGALGRHGLRAAPLNAELHRRFVDERVRRLREGTMLDHTEQVHIDDFARFTDGLLIGGGRETRPVVFFDLSGEDLERSDRVTRFLAGVSAFVFVVDPLRALRLPYLDPVRERNEQRETDLGDRAFGAVLDRIPRAGAYLDTPAAIVIGKSDLVRFEPPVDRWLGEHEDATPTPRTLREESRDAYAFLRHHAGPAWLKPFAECARCTLHFVTATGGERQGDGFPQGVRPRRALTPLLSILAMCGLLPGIDPWEVGL
ncbi:hypothetical protein [Streptomyces macrosporus]|uniref:AAA+ ATPase domain-containing protein n=1 Tax=Streptomyces macrosporus TaxID=44032 RepID=A0ABP5XCI1_9ACTN